jgi:hypothetical protein
LSELLSAHSRIQIKVANPRQAVEVLRRTPGVTSVSLDGDGIEVAAAPGSAAAISRALAEKGLFVEAIVEKRDSLEDLFFEVTGHTEDD